MKKHNKDNRPTHKLLVQVRDHSKPINQQTGGIPVKWEEVLEIDLGSIKKPNKEVFQIKFEPIYYEEDEDDRKRPNFRDFFGSFG
jgi:hypothetical protein